MPVPVIPEGQLPTIISKPNQRFATTALSTEFRRFAVNGELLKDQTTGELFLKRKDDGKVVSFFQNKKYMHDIVLELRVLLTTNPGFRYPAESEEAFFVSTNYDLVAINKENLINIYTDDIVINNTSPDSLYTLKFNVSGRCNGFFVRHSTRDCDKPAIEMITNYYNTYIKSYTGNDPVFLEEKAKFNTTNWEDSNATILYNVTCVYQPEEGEEVRHVYACTSNVRLNETCYVSLPELAMRENFPNGVTSILVEVNQIKYHKIHFMIAHQDEIGEHFKALLQKFQFQEGRMESHIFNVLAIIDKPDGYMPLGNDILLAFIDLPYMHRYMGKMTELLDKGDFIFSIPRPLNSDWLVNGVWAEMVRIIDKNGTITNTGSENSGLLDELEDIFGPTKIHHGYFTTQPERSDDYLLADSVDYVGGA